MSNPPPFQSQICPAPPFNATNFTQANSTILSTLQTYANDSPSYPWATGSNAQQIYLTKQNVSYFTTLNQQTAAVRNGNKSMGIFGTQPYPVFKTDRERMMYIQGQALTASRNQITGRNPSGPAGVPCSTIYQIINS